MTYDFINEKQFFDCALDTRLRIIATYDGAIRAFANYLDWLISKR